MTIKPVTSEGKLLVQISGQLAELIGILRPEPPPAEPPQDETPAEKPEPDKKAPAKKTAQRRTRKVDGR